MPIKDRPRAKNKFSSIFASIQQNKTLSNFSSAVPSAGMAMLNALVLDSSITTAAYMISADDNDVTNVDYHLLAKQIVFATLFFSKLHRPYHELLDHRLCVALISGVFVAHTKLRMLVSRNVLNIYRASHSLSCICVVGVAFFGLLEIGTKCVLEGPCSEFLQSPFTAYSNSSLGRGSSLATINRKNIISMAASMRP